MSVNWPWALAALVAVPLLLVMRWWLNRRRRRLAVRVSSLAPILAALPGRSRWRRRLPALLFVLGLLALGGATARPQAAVRVPSDATSILLAIDVSASMCSTDVPPNRLTAAQQAAREFVEGQRDGPRIGLVAFSGISGVLVAPTDDTDELLEAIDGLRTARGTAIGQAILSSVDAIAEVNSDVPPTGVDLPAAPTPGPDGGDSGGGEGDGGDPGGSGSGLADAVGGYEPDTIVVLTDGANTHGVDPVTAAEQAAARRLRIYTIGFGTSEPAPLVCPADQVDTGSSLGRFPGGGWPGGGGFGGGGDLRNLLRIDEPTLRQVAEMTGGEYFRAQDAEQLSDTLRDLPGNVEVQREDVEVTVWFVLAATLLVALAVLLSLRWNRSSSVPVVSASRAGRRG